MPAELAGQIRTELDMFCLWLRKRAALVQELRAQVEAGPPCPYGKFSLADVGRLTDG